MIQHPPRPGFTRGDTITLPIEIYERLLAAHNRLLRVELYGENVIVPRDEWEDRCRCREEDWDTLHGELK